MKIENGNKVKVHYVGTFDDGTKFDSSEGKEPLEFTIGEKKVIPGFENALIGMEKGEEKQIKLLANEAYGEKNPQMVQEIPKTSLPKDLEVKEGMMLMLKTPEGQQLPAKVVENKETTIMLDMNHPLAGKNLNFDLKVEEVVQ
ncbi:MAG: peptidylprolyl isomerase [Candidatus Woesearchaeota archaeon]